MCRHICISRYCGARNISQSIKGKLARKKGLNVSFTSNKKKFGGGAQCTAECIDPVPTTATTTTTTTATTTTNTLLCGHDVGSSPSNVMRHIKSQGSTYFIIILFSTPPHSFFLHFSALACPAKDTSCIAADGHSNVITTTTTPENVQECGSK